MDSESFNPNKTIDEDMKYEKSKPEVTNNLHSEEKLVIECSESDAEPIDAGKESELVDLVSAVVVKQPGDVYKEDNSLQLQKANYFKELCIFYITVPPRSISHVELTGMIFYANFARHLQLRRREYLYRNLWLILRSGFTIENGRIIYTLSRSSYLLVNSVPQISSSEDVTNMPKPLVSWNFNWRDVLLWSLFLFVVITFGTAAYNLTICAHQNSCCFYAEVRSIELYFAFLLMLCLQEGRN